MVASEEIVSLNAFLKDQAMTPEERRQLEALLERAQKGDSAALSRVRQTAQERCYAPLAGKDMAIEPGPLMVCPVDPLHYRTYRREIGQELICPEHEKPLIIIESK